MNKKIRIILLSVVAMGMWAAPCAWAQLDAFKRSAVIESEIDNLVRETNRKEQDQRDAAAQGVAPQEKVFSPAQMTRNLVPLDKKDARVTLDFADANLEDVLSSIGEVVGINVIIDPALKGKKVDFHLKDVLVEEALRLLYNSYGLDSVLVGNSLYVSYKDKIKQGALETKLIKLTNLAVDEAKNLIKDSIDVVNTSNEINSLLLMGSAEEISKVEALLKKADQPQPLVVLEAKIIEVDRDAVRTLGVDWPDSLSFSFQETQMPTALGSPAAKMLHSVFQVGKLARTPVQFNEVLRMLETQNKAKLLSNPRVTTLNNKESQIFVGDRVPYTITTVTGGVASTEVRFAEPGIRLKITPSIIGDNFVVIKIQPEVSYIYGWRGPSEQYPWIKTREATAYVRVKSGETIVLGGLLVKENKNNEFKVPFLGSIPWVGGLFRYNTYTVTDTELIISVTPTIIVPSAK